MNLNGTLSILRLALATIVLAAFVCIPCVSGAPVDDITSEVPFTFEKGRVIVSAKIMNDMPVDFILSTGEKHSIINWELLFKYGLRGSGAYDPPFRNDGSDRLYRFTTVPDIRVGQSQATTLNLRFGSLTEVSQAVGREIFGVLGADFFKGRVVEFDFKKKIVRFFSKSDAELMHNARRVDIKGTILLRMVESTDYYGNATLPIVEDISFNSKKIRVLLDTGAAITVGLRSSEAKKLGFITPPEKSAARTDTIRSLRLATYELTNVPVLISAKGTEQERDFGERGIVVGNVVLQGFVITFDFRGKVVFLEPISK